MVLSDFQKQAIVAFEQFIGADRDNYIAPDITDRFFCFIQNDRVLMKNYLDTVAETGSLQVVNSQMAQYICQHFGLKSGREKHHPYSNLIQSYHELI